MHKADRLKNLTSAVFSEIERLRREVEASGISTINLSIGSPDRPPSDTVKQALVEAVSDPAQYGYALTEGLEVFREAVCDWYLRRFQVTLDRQREVLSLMGSQDGLSHIFLAYVDPGDYALLPDPGYPVYNAGLHLAGGNFYPLPLLGETGFLPQLDSIPGDIARKARIMVLNYPSNPSAAIANLRFFSEVVEFAKTYDIIVCHDIAYSELAFEGYRPPSFLQVPGAKEVGVEFNSLSKTFNLAGARLGFVAGNSTVIADLALIKSNIDYGVFKPVQIAGATALRGSASWIRENAATYEKRRNVLIESLKKIGWDVPKPLASMFVWAPLPRGYDDSQAFAEEVLRRTGVVVVPGVGFGELGEGYVRIALVADEKRLAEAAERIGAGFNFKK